MQNFFGSSCPYCGKEFTPDDDIVVCPECGTPHHRSCYNEHSSCANEEKHSEDFEWKNSNSAAAKPGFSENQNSKTVLCAYCKTENPENSHYCLNCGSPLSSGKNRGFSSAEEFQRERTRAFTERFSSFEGVSAKEAALYVRNNVGYFLPRFAAFSKGAKFDTNFSAFIFSYFYLFYRKMYSLGAVVFIITSLLSIPTFLLDFQMLQEQYIELGMLSQMIWEVPHQEALAIYSVIASVLIWIIRIALMLFCNRIYYRKTIDNIKKAQVELADKDEKTISAFFNKKGGVELIVPIIFVALAFIASFALAGFIVSSDFFILPAIENIL